VAERSGRVLPRAGRPVRARLRFCGRADPEEPTTGLTAAQGIDDALHLREGQSIIIYGASGGVGTMALRLAKLRGARPPTAH